MRHGLQHTPSCVLCDQSDETMAHILSGCSFSHTVLHEVLSWISQLLLAQPRGVTLWIDGKKLASRFLRTSARKVASSVIQLMAWCIWKHRKAIILNARLDHNHLIDTIKSETRQWAVAGTSRLAALLPEGATTSV